MLDPACGSGHILVTGFELLFEMYLEVGYNARNAVESILKHNLIGLDIDDRAMQLARFAVLLKGAELLKGNGSGAIASRELMNNPVLIPHVYSFPEEQQFESEELQTFLGGEGQQYSAELNDALTLLNQGKNIGSALKIELPDGAIIFIEQQYNNWRQKQETSALDIQQTDIWNRLKPMLDVLLVLAKKYAAVVANPPYMGQRNMNEELKKYVNRHYPLTKSDLFAVFMEVCINLNIKQGLMGMINQHSWMFLSSYEKLRNEVLNNYGIVSMLHLGPRTFEELSGEVVQSTAFVINNSPLTINNLKGSTYFRLVDYRNNTDKEKNFLKRNNRYPSIPQTNFSKIPGSPIAYWVSEKRLNTFTDFKSVKDVADPKVGMLTTNNDLFMRNFWEVSYDKIGIGFKDKKEAIESHKKWIPYSKGGSYRKWYGNNEFVVNFENDGNTICDYIDNQPGVKVKSSGRVTNRKYFYKPALTWSLTSSGSFGIRFRPEGFIFDIAGMSIFSDDQIELINLAAFLNSCVAFGYLNLLNPTLSFQKGDLEKIPTNLPTNELTNSNVCTETSKKDWDSRETSWDFLQSPLLNESTSLSNAYKLWEEDVTKDFFQLHANEEELNRIFIDIYGLQDELTPDVALKDITILQDELDRNQLEEDEVELREQGLGISRVDSGLPVVPEGYSLPISKEEVISQFISYSIGVFMGRYRLDKPGLNIAHPNPTEEETANYEYNDHTIEISDDGIVPLMGDDCNFPDDALKRTTELVHAIWGEESLTENINFIHNALGVNLHRWLTERFWKYHTSGKMYKKKPIYWLFSSNVRRPQNAAFKVLVYMHRMDKYTLYNIQRKYLYPHQEYISQEIERMEKNEADLNRTELRELEKLRKWEVELRDYSEKLKELANEEIEFDLDDGVTENYKLFEGVVAKI